VVGIFKETGSGVRLDRAERKKVVVSVNVVEIAGGLEVAIGQAAWGGISEGWLGVTSPSINGGTNSAMASTCM